MGERNAGHGQQARKLELLVCQVAHTGRSPPQSGIRARQRLPWCRVARAESGSNLRPRGLQDAELDDHGQCEDDGRCYDALVNTRPDNTAQSVQRQPQDDEPGEEPEPGNVARRVEGAVLFEAMIVAPRRIVKIHTLIIMTLRLSFGATIAPTFTGRPVSQPTSQVAKMRTIEIFGGVAWPRAIVYYRTINEFVAQRLGRGGVHCAKLVLAQTDFEAWLG